MLKISNIRLEVGEELCNDVICRNTPISSKDIDFFKLVKKSVDARKKNDIHYNCSVLVKVKNEDKYLKFKNVSKYQKYQLTIPKIKSDLRPIIVGCGPAGLFAALYLSYSGLKPLLIERGSDVDKRIRAVENFWKNGVFDAKTNVQFGEGGAGTFSDGKLTTGVNDERMEFVKEQLVKFGAPEDILYLAKPHVGTDKLSVTVKNIRNEIIRLGGEVLFETQLTDIDIENGKISAVEVLKNDKKESYKCDVLLLAIGHSA